MKLFKNSCVRNIFVAAVAFGVAYGAQSLWAVPYNCVTGCSGGCKEYKSWCYNTATLEKGYFYSNVLLHKPAFIKPDQCVEDPDGGAAVENKTFTQRIYTECEADCALGTGETKVWTTGIVGGTVATPENLSFKHRCTSSSS